MPNVYIVREGDSILSIPKYNMNNDIAEYASPSLRYIEEYEFKDIDVVFRSNNTYERILHLYLLHTNWDGYSAKDFDLQVINKGLDIYNLVRSLIKEMSLNMDLMEPFVAPGSDSTVCFYWDGKRFPYRQLEIDVSLRKGGYGTDISYLKSEGDKEEEGLMDVNVVRQLIMWLAEV